MVLWEWTRGIVNKYVAPPFNFVFYCELFPVSSFKWKGGLAVDGTGGRMECILAYSLLPALLHNSQFLSELPSTSRELGERE